MTNVDIRSATASDADTILGFITELAIYEKAEHEVLASAEDIARTLNNNEAHALICSHEGKAIGFALYFFNYSTWVGRPGLFLEDLYVSSEYRGKGAGKALLVYLARLAKQNGCGRFEWNVLDWNEPAINFYRSIGAKPQDEWITYRLDVAGISALAENG